MLGEGKDRAAYGLIKEEEEYGHRSQDRNMASVLKAHGGGQYALNVHEAGGKVEGAFWETR